MQKDDQVVYDTIIVGAGVCGLRAGQYLQKGGKSGQQVLLLEARDRVGGRVYPLDTGRLDNITPLEEADHTPIVIEAGANWIHDLSNKNPICKLANLLNLETVNMYNEEYEVDPDSVIGDRSYYDKHGVPRVYERKELLNCENIHKSLMLQLAAVNSKLGKCKASDRHSATLKDALLSAMQRLEAKNPFSDDTKQLLDFSLEVEATSNAADLDKLGFSAWYNSPDESENGEALVKGGISQIIPALSTGQDVRLRCCVKEIVWGGTCADVSTASVDPIQLKIINDTSNHDSENEGKHDGISIGKEEILSAWNVVVTIPMSCLQQGTIEFIPPLPQEKVTAMAAIGVGLLDVVVFRFENSFWPANKKVFGIPPSESYSWRGNIANIENDKTETMVFPLDELFYSFLPLSHSRKDDSKLLLAYVHGRRAVQVEQMTNGDIASAACLSLRMIFGDIVTNPVGCAIHKWGQDRFSMGSYCATCPGTTAEAMKIMASPMCGITNSLARKLACKARQSCLQFAGEGTDYECIGLLQGAHNSGTRAAQHIVKFHM
jgi:monoamine oxidase